MYIVQAHSDVQRQLFQSTDGGKKLSGLFVIHATIFQNQYVWVTLPFYPTTCSCLATWLWLKTSDSGILLQKYSSDTGTPNLNRLWWYLCTSSIKHVNLLSSVAMIWLILASSRTCFKNLKKRFPRGQGNKWLNRGTLKWCSEVKM